MDFERGDYSQVTQTALAAPGGAIQALFTVDLHDGFGPRKGSVRVDVWGPMAFSVSGSNLPIGIADSENATMLAVIHSFTQNQQMMAQMRRERSPACRRTRRAPMHKVPP